MGLIEAVDTTVVDFDGEPIARPITLAGDKAYRADWIDDYLLSLDIQPVIPSRANEIPGQRVVEFDREAYRDRNIIERLIGWLKESRRIMTRFEKTALNFGGMIKLGCIKRLLRLICNQVF